MNVLNALFTLGTAGLGFTLAYGLGSLALARRRHADLIRDRLAPMPRVRRPYLAFAAPRFIDA